MLSWWLSKVVPRLSLLVTFVKTTSGKVAQGGFWSTRETVLAGLVSDLYLRFFDGRSSDGLTVRTTQGIQMTLSMIDLSEIPIGQDSLFCHGSMSLCSFHLIFISTRHYSGAPDD